MGSDVNEAVLVIVGRDQKWRLYDEKYFFQSSSAYTGKDGAEWILGLRDYLTGRTAKLDKLFDFIEKQSEDLGNDSAGCSSVRAMRRSASSCGPFCPRC